MFSRLAPRYDLFNSLASLGMDRPWRKALMDRVSRSMPTVSHGGRLLDLGTGTGVLLFEAAQNNWNMTGVDISLSMLERSSQKAGDFNQDFSWLCADAGVLPFQDNSFHAVVSAFVLRNLNEAGILAKALKEIKRVLVSGGTASLLDLTQPENRWLRGGHYVYSRTVLPVIGRGIFGRAWPGTYLRRTIETFPHGVRLKNMLLECGFSNVNIQSLSGGIASLILGSKK